MLNQTLQTEIIEILETKYAMNMRPKKQVHPKESQTDHVLDKSSYQSLRAEAKNPENSSPPLRSKINEKLVAVEDKISEKFGDLGHNIADIALKTYHQAANLGGKLKDEGIANISKNFVEHEIDSLRKDYKAFVSLIGSTPEAESDLIDKSLPVPSKESLENLKASGPNEEMKSIYENSESLFN